MSDLPIVRYGCSMVGIDVPVRCFVDDGSGVTKMMSEDEAVDLLLDAIEAQTSVPASDGADT